MNVFYFCSDEYAGVAAVSMLSLMVCNITFDRISFYVADDGISRYNKERLQGLITGLGHEVNFINLPGPSELLEFPFVDRYQIGHSYPRMCIGTLLPESVGKVLCLDSDTLVLDDLGELWDTDMGDGILAGVADCINLEAYRRQFGLGVGNVYCNAGVYLVDLNRWRCEDVEGGIRRVIREKNGNVFFFEQTLMNYSCRGRITKLHPRYNAYSLFYALDYDDFTAWRLPTDFYGKREIEEAKANPAIVHFTRNFYMRSHPWEGGCEHPLASTYQSFMSEIAWAEPWADRRSAFVKARHRLMRSVPQRLVCLIAGFLYNEIRPKMWWRNE